MLRRAWRGTRDGRKFPTVPLREFRSSSDALHTICCNKRHVLTRARRQASHAETENCSHVMHRGNRKRQRRMIKRIKFIFNVNFSARKKNYFPVKMIAAHIRLKRKRNNAYIVLYAMQRSNYDLFIFREFSLAQEKKKSVFVRSVQSVWPFHCMRFVMCRRHFLNRTRCDHPSMPNARMHCAIPIAFAIQFATRIHKRARPEEGSERHESDTSNGCICAVRAARSH